MTDDRLSALDASFLYLESPSTPMHIASLAVYDDGPAPIDDVRQAFADRLHLVPRFRQRLASPPAGMHRPVWVDDPYFTLDAHLRHVALPEPGTPAQLKELAGHLLSMPLDRSCPLWEMFVIDGLSDGGFAVLSKTHHCLWDGVSGADVHAILLDDSPEPSTVIPETWEPGPEPTFVELALDAATDRVSEAVDAGRSLVRAATHPLQTARDAIATARGLSTLANSVLRPSPRSPLNTSIQGRRRYAFTTAPLDRAKAIGKRAGGSVNDVVLAAVGGALRRWMIGRGVRPTDLDVMVPVSLRDDGPGVGNRVAMLVVPVAASERDPRRRLERMAEAMRERKASGAIAAGQVVADLAGFAPPLVVAELTRLQQVNRAFNLLVTNIPGPPMPLYLCGRRLRHLYPQAPLAANQALAVAVMSYDATLCFGLLGDRDAMHDLDAFEHFLEESLAELEVLAPSTDGTVRQGPSRERELTPVS